MILAGIPFSQLIANFMSTVERSGATILRRQEIERRPSQFQVLGPDRSTDCCVFLWTITPGGGGPAIRPAEERRIQLTNVDRFPLRPGIRTIVGGWSEEFGVYAFWDPRRHRTFSSRSPSLQISAGVLRQAKLDGIATYIRPSAEGREVVVAVDPSSLLWYVQNGEALHNTDIKEGALMVHDLIIPAPEMEQKIIESSESEAETIRRLELVQTMRAFRESRFRPQVLQAYSYRCAVCGYAMKLVDAAHIIPVSHPKSTDDIANGIALCRLHHAAYDNGLLGIRPTYEVILNPDAIGRLQDANLLDGLTAFRDGLPKSIRIPATQEVRPHPANLKVGLIARQWPASLI